MAAVTVTKKELRHRKIMSSQTPYVRLTRKSEKTHTVGPKSRSSHYDILSYQSMETTLEAIIVNAQSHIHTIA